MYRVFDGHYRHGFTLNDRSRGWDETVSVTGYQSLWPLRFAAELRVLREALQPLAPQIEHVGSTAVPGLAARPIIDIALALDQPSLIAPFSERLRNFGYQPDAPGFEEQATFVRRERGVRTHHVQVVAAGGPAWQALLAFRDRLRAQPALAFDFAQLKAPLVGRHSPTPPAYREAKAAFVRRVLQIAADLPAG